MMFFKTCLRYGFSSKLLWRSNIPFIGACRRHFCIRSTYHSEISTRILSNFPKNTIGPGYSNPISRLTTTSTSRIEKFILPDIGEGIKEVIIKSWHVKVGDTVSEFDSICDVESDKATATISSRYNGVIRKLYYDVEALANVGQPLVDVELSASNTDHQKVDDPKTDIEGELANEAEESHQVPQIGKSHIRTLPSVRRLARHEGVDLSKVSPTGKQGHILKEDVLKFLKDSSPKTVIQGASKSDQDVIETKLSGFQKAMFKTMTQSLKIPHFNYADEIDMTNLVNLSDQWKLANGEKISQLAFIVKTVSLALKDFPELNASIDEERQMLMKKPYHNVGIAVDTEFGLVVPNIKNVQDLSIKGINLEMKRLRDLGYVSKLQPNDLSGGTITISNIGAIGGVFGVPVILPPEIVILALGRTRKLPRFDSAGRIEERHVMQFVWSADHRVVEGATISRFSNLVKSYIENPSLALLKMS